MMEKSARGEKQKQRKKIKSMKSGGGEVDVPAQAELDRVVAGTEVSVFQGLQLAMDSTYV